MLINAATTKMRSARWSLLVLLFAVLAVREACAQDLVVRGAIKDEAGVALVGVKLTLRAGSHSYSISTVTKPDGSYVLAPPRAGVYKLEAELVGFQKATRVHVSVNSKSPVVLNLTLARTASALDAVQLYDAPQLSSGQYTDPAAAGGYSNTLVNNSRELVEQYLQRENSAAVPEQSERDLYRKGAQLLADRKYGLAIDLFELATGQFPRSAQLQIGLGLALYSSGRFREAIEALVAACDLAPSDRETYLFLAKTCLASNQPSDDVVRRMQRFAQLFPREPLASYNYAMILWKVNGRQQSEADLSQVESLLHNALALEPAFADARLELGILYDDQQKTSQAINEFQEAIRLKPDLALAHYHLAQTYKHAGQARRAEQEFQVYERLRNQQ